MPSSANAESKSDQAETIVRPALRDGIAKLRRVELRHGRPTPAGSEPIKDDPGNEPTEDEAINSSTTTSISSEPPSSDSNRRWRKPKTVREFAAQANDVATMILNGEIDMEQARGYASLARVVAQAASVEVTRARFLKREPDLSLE